MAIKGEVMGLGRKTLPIKKVYLGMYDGPHATPKPSDSGPIFLGIKNVSETGQLDFSQVRHISEEEYPRWIKRVEPRPGDIVFSYEATLNRYAIIPSGFRGCLGRRMALIRPDESKICGRFLYYYFFSNEWREVIAKNILTGSTVDRIPITKLPDFPVIIPPLQIQRKIASILSAYDDLIENNLRRIKILEEMAQNLYREWFVKFRFPGHDNTRFVDSELGRIPEGWEVTSLKDLAEITYGHPFKSKEFNVNGDGLGAVRIRDIRSGKVSTYTTEEGKPKHLIDNGDILVGMDGQFHIGKWTGGVAWLVQRVARFRPKNHMGRYFLFLSIEKPIKHLENTIVGTTVGHLSAKDLNSMYILVPSKKLLNMVNSIFEPMYNLEMRLRFRNTNLRQTRNLLLPKLISGEVDVSELDIATQEEMAR